MNAAVLTPRPSGGYQLAGELSFNTVVGLLQQGSSAFQGQSSLEIDLSSVTHADSAGLALLLEWLREARANGVTLRYLSVPPQLHALATISEVADFLKH